MQNVIEKAISRINREVEKNRAAYKEASDWYRDTGYDRYWKKMQRLDAEYDELRTFLGQKETDDKKYIENENASLYAENKKLKQFIGEVKSMVTYIHADYWSDPKVVRLYEKLKDFRQGN